MTLELSFSKENAEHGLHVTQFKDDAMILNKNNDARNGTILTGWRTRIK